ncbi:hypothetical protein DdX_00247 [Ditylenchus destructor]|uniref:Fibronectin type-III domain-containing protein n=1 Tax=Ditylenchus destructor TaxID=166010 RepID=A0AAD4NEX0_9BILA|nr:hypothetical protein DdX_00247 [Ditylenchus destructor]
MIPSSKHGWFMNRRITWKSIVLNGLFFFATLVILSGDLVNAAVSRRAKCAIECYTKCAESGTPKAVYCNCPLSVELEPCNSVNEQLLKEKTLERPINADSSYKDVRTISIRTEQFTNAFIYVFEYSTVSADSDLWIFAGASSSPQITFTVPDACRDYQFRTMVVLRSTDPSEQLAVFRPKHIPVQFPAFTVPQESIRLDQPKQSSDEQSIHVSISWHNPPGYEDSDIYGYESPIAYPIRCMTPEEHLSQPRVELIEGGARMHLNLPIDVLQEKCRIYMEVRMIPRCVRVENFDIQASIELDCQKFPHINYCKKEMSPQCTDVVDLWGRKDDGGVTIVWQPPNSPIQSRTDDEPIISSGVNEPPNESLAMPLYYIVNFGLTHSQGSQPIIRRRILHSKEIKIPGNATKADLLGPLKLGMEYGVQICGIYSNGRTQSPFHIVPVIPFQCTKCQLPQINTAPPGDQCVECNKIETADIVKTSSDHLSSHLNPIPGRPLEELAPVECLGLACASRNVSSTHFISSNTASLDVVAPTRTHTTIHSPNIAASLGDPKKPASDSAVLRSSAFEDITADNFNYNSSEKPKISEHPSPQQWHSKTVNVGKVIPLQTESAEILQNDTSSTFETTTPTFVTTMLAEQNSAEQSSSPTVSLFAASSELYNRAMISTSTQIPFTKGFPTSSVSTNLAYKLTSNKPTDIYEMPATLEIDKTTPVTISPQPSSKLLTTTAISTIITTDKPLETTTVIGKVAFVRKPASDVREEPTPPAALARSNADRRLHQKSHPINHHKLSLGLSREPCRQKSGILCEFGCVDDTRCECPKMESQCIRGIHCPQIKDLRAVYDHVSHQLKLYSKEIASLLMKRNGTWPLYDKLYMEIGELNKPADRIHTPLTGTTFGKGSESKEHVMVNINTRLNHVREQTLFDSQPFEWTLENGLNIGEKHYGISVCALNSSLVPIILDGTSIESHSDGVGPVAFYHNPFPAFTQTLLSPVEMSSKSGLDDQSFQRSLDTHKGMIIFIGPVFFLMGLLAFGATILCVNICRRRRKRRRLLKHYNSATSSRHSTLGQKYLIGGGPRTLGAGFLPTISPPTATISAIGPQGLPQGSFAPLVSNQSYGDGRRHSVSVVDGIETGPQNTTEISRQHNGASMGPDRYYVHRNVHF